MFDATLAAIQHAGQRHDARYWVERISDFADASASAPWTGWWNAGFQSARTALTGTTPYHRHLSLSLPDSRRKPNVTGPY